MESEFTAQAEAFARVYLIPTAWKLLGAVALWVVGSWIIKLVRAAFSRFLHLRQFDVTLASYVEASAGALLQVLLFIAVLGVLGIETTSFAALLAAAGLAVGAAWSGLLANFAAGIFLLVFRPFKVGDTIAAVGINGTVREIGLFVTSIVTSDNVVTYVGNNRLFSENVQNFSATPFRRVDLTIQLLPGGRLGGREHAASPAYAPDPASARHAGARHRDPVVQHRRNDSGAGAGGAPLLSQ